MFLLLEVLLYPMLSKKIYTCMLLAAFHVQITVKVLHGVSERSSPGEFLKEYRVGTCRH